MSKRSNNYPDVMPTGGYENPPLVGAGGLRADAMPLRPGYQGEDRNAAPRDQTVVGTMGWSQRAGNTVIAHPPEAPVVETPEISETETPAAPDVLQDPDLAGLSGAALARAVLARNGHPPTDPVTRAEHIIANRVNRHLPPR